MHDADTMFKYLVAGLIKAAEKKLVVSHQCADKLSS